MSFRNKYIATKNYQSPYPSSILFKKGERVRIGEKSDHDPEWDDWYWCEGESSQKAWVPKQYLQGDEKQAVLKQNFDAKELTITAGEILLVAEIVNGFGMARKEDGQEGWAPLNHITLVK